MANKRKTPAGRAQPRRARGGERRATIVVAPSRPTQNVELAGRLNTKPQQPQSRWAEVGTVGLPTMAGFIQAAYQRELTWPGVYPLYNRLWRSDPEIAMIRIVYSAMVGSVQFKWEGPDKPTKDDKLALEFAESALEDLDGGIERFRDKLVGTVPFFGWGSWEMTPGLRKQGWRPPNDDTWRSEFDDGLVGIRRLAWRDHSSFLQWDIDEATGRLRGWYQLDPPNPQARLPIEKLLHITFGDADNPEGLSPLEAVWRLERLKYGYEVVMGIGSEHAAGYLNVTKTQAGELTPTDKENIRAAARAVLTAQEGNYAAWPFGLEGKVEDVPFGAASALLESIRYYGLLKMAVFNMAWVGMSTLSGVGSYASMQDSSAMWIVGFNAMLEGFARQIDAQFGKTLFDLNPGAFPGMTKRPRLKVTAVEKFVALDALASFWTAIKDTMPVGEEDWKAIRRKSGFLPETIPTVTVNSKPPTQQSPEDKLPGATNQSPEAAQADAEDEIDEAEMAAGGRGVMLALFPDAETAKALAVADGLEVTDLHLTVAYLGKAEALDDSQVARLNQVTQSFAMLNPPLDGTVTGLGEFTSDDGSTSSPDAPVVALVDLPDGADWRGRLLAALIMNGFMPRSEHGFIPHITLKYGERAGVYVAAREVRFESLTLAVGDRRWTYPLTGGEANLAKVLDEIGAARRAIQEMREIKEIEA